MPTNLSPLAAAPLPRQNAVVSGIGVDVAVVGQSGERLGEVEPLDRVNVHVYDCVPVAIGSSWTNRSSSRRQSVGLVAARSRQSRAMWDWSA